MSKLSFGGLIHVPPKSNYEYKQTLFVPIECVMGPRCAVINSKEQLYSKFTPSDLINCKSLELYLDLGYELVIYRTNYKDERSGIRLTDSGFSYFDPSKSYVESDGVIESQSDLTRNLTVLFNWDVVTDILLSESGSHYIKFDIDGLTYEIRIQESKSDVEYSDLTTYVKYLTDGVPDQTKAINGIKSAISDFIGMKIDGNRVISQCEFLAESDIPGLIIEDDDRFTYDIVHSNSLKLPGVSIVSRNSNSGTSIHLDILEIGSQVQVTVSNRLENSNLLQEEFYGDIDPESTDYIINVLNNSKLIKVTSGEWVAGISGSFDLNYTTKNVIPLSEVNFLIELDNIPQILFIVDLNNYYSKSELWDELELDSEWNRPYDPSNEDLLNDPYLGISYRSKLAELDKLYEDYIVDATIYFNKITKLATKMNSIVLHSYLPINSTKFSHLTNSIEVLPKIVDQNYQHTFELLLSNVSINRIQGEIEFNGRTTESDYLNPGNCELLYSQYRYLLTEPELKFIESNSIRSIKLKLSEYLYRYSITKYLTKILKRESIAHNEVPDLENMKLLVMNKFRDLLSDIEITPTKNKRQLELEVTMKFTRQTNYSQILTAHLIGD